MTEYYLVDIASIFSKRHRSEFNEIEIGKLAESILCANILLKPLILKQIGPESYEVIERHFEYFAAVRAKEINPRKGEMVSAFVVPSKDQQNITEQLSILTSSNSHNEKRPFVSDTNTISDQRLTNIESRLERVISEIKDESKKEFKKLNNEIVALKQQIPPKIEVLEALNSLNDFELTLKLQTANIKGKTAKKIISSILNARKKKPFSSFSDVYGRVDEIGITRMFAIVDAWTGNR